MGISFLAASEVSLFDVNSWWWAIEHGLYWIISAIQHAYNYLVGITPVSNSAAKPDVNISGDVLFNLFSDERVARVGAIFTIAAVIALVTFLVIGFIKVHFKNEDQLASRGKMVAKSLQSLLTMLLLPGIMFVVILFVGYFFQFLTATMNLALGTTGDSTDIATIIHQICVPSGTDVHVTETWDISYNLLKTNAINDSYNYVLGMLTSGILIYVLLATCLTLVERLIDVILLYLLGPFALARSPLDDGNSFNLWRDLVVTRLLSAGGIIISMYLYFMLLGNIMSWFDPLETDSSVVQTAKEMVKIFFIIGGAFATKKGALIISQLVSQNAGISEGMSQSQSLHMLSSGLRIGAGAIFGAASKMGQGALLAGRGAAGAGGNVVKTAMSNAGRANIPVQAGDNGTMNGGAATAGGGGVVAGAAAGVAEAVAKGAGPRVSSTTFPQPEEGVGGGGVRVAPGGDPLNAAGMDDVGATDNEDAFNNPNAPGRIGEVAQRNKGYGTVRDALLYGGISGLAGYGLGKLLGGAGHGIKSLGKGAIGKIKMHYQNSESGKNRAALKQAKVQVGELRDSQKTEQRNANQAIKRERSLLKGVRGVPKPSGANGQFSFARGNDFIINQRIARDEEKIRRVNAQIDKKYGGIFKSDPTKLDAIKATANQHRLSQMELKIKQLSRFSNNPMQLAQRFNKMQEESGVKGGIKK